MMEKGSKTLQNDNVIQQIKNVAQLYLQEPMVPII